MTPRLASVSVDLDEIRCYQAIHGLSSEAAGSAAHLVYDVALPRIEAFARAHDLPVTLFAIGADLARPASAASLRALAGRGHAVENHTQGHRYDLTRLSRDEMLREVREGAASIERAVGRAPEGFRAPGYTMVDALLDVLEELGVRWDSSVFPCPAYHGAKALVLASMRARGRSSRSIVGPLRVLLAPTRPYRPSARHERRGDRRLVELPIQVTPWLRLPVIGTSLGLAGPLGARLLAARCAGEPLVNLELHGIDFLDVSDGLAHLAPHQPELRVPLDRRMEALTAFLDELRRQRRAFVRLDEAARAFGA